MKKENKAQSKSRPKGLFKIMDGRLQYQGVNCTVTVNTKYNESG